MSIFYKKAAKYGQNCVKFPPPPPHLCPSPNNLGFQSLRAKTLCVFYAIEEDGGGGGEGGRGGGGFKNLFEALWHFFKEKESQLSHFASTGFVVHHTFLPVSSRHAWWDGSYSDLDCTLLHPHTPLQFHQLFSIWRMISMISWSVVVLVIQYRHLRCICDWSTAGRGFLGACGIGILCA